MRKIVFIVILIASLIIIATAQEIDFPGGIEEKPKSKNNGKVHTILTITQRGEYVFETFVEVYDLQGKLIETMNSNANIEIHSGTLVRLGDKTIFVYDDNGRLTKSQTFTPEGHFIGYETFTFDNKNRLIENILYTADKKERGRRKYTYFPEKREVIANIQYDYGGKIIPFKVLFVYDENKQLTKRVHYEEDDSTSHTTTFEYDKNGNLIKITPKGKFNSPHLFSYEFDKQGNWIEQRDTQVQINKNGKEELNPEWMRMYRVITYYTDSEVK